MNKLLILFFCLFGISSCSLFQSDPMEEMYELPNYRNRLTKLLEQKKINKQDFFLMNYGIIRQRPYYNYSLEGKSYGEILEIAKDYSVNGLGIPTSFQQNGQQDQIEVKVHPEGGGLVRLDDSKQMFKALKFSATFTNISEQTVALMNASFIINGPFKEHIITVGYEINCKIPKGSYLEVSFLVDARYIKDNILYQGHPQATFLMIDQLLTELSIQSSGLSLASSSQYYEECLFGGMRLTQDHFLNYEEALDSMQWQVKDASGKTIELHYGNAHFLPEKKDEPIPIEAFQ